MLTYTHLHTTACLISEKYDGIQARWDGRQLTSRDGNTFHAPAWFTAGLPNRPLTGELWAGRGRFEAVLSICRAADSGDRWQSITYMVFDGAEAGEDLGQHAKPVTRWQVATGEVTDAMQEIVSAGGEGIVIRDADGTDYKLKPQSDDDAVVIGYTDGKGRHAGRCGALQVEDQDGRRFKLGAGLTDLDRDNPPPIGAVVEFAFQGRTGRGVPRFARFLRKRAEAVFV